MQAILIVDMIHDFVDGKFGSKEAKQIIPNIQRVIEKFRNHGLIVYLKDAHKKDDPEIKVWGEHAMKGTWGSEIVDDIRPNLDDLVIEKATYDGFLFTSLEEILKDNNVTEVYICGVATDICIKHTAFGAFVRGFKVRIIEDACAGTSAMEHRRALKYMESIYGAEIVECDDL